MGDPKDISIPIQRTRASDYNATELLDRTLGGLVERPLNTPASMRKTVTALELHKTLFYDRENSLALDNEEFWSILDKLELDGFIKKKDNELPTNNIRLTFNGLFFVRSGGYNQFEKDKKQEALRVEGIQVRQISLQKNTVLLTGLAAVATCAMAPYYILELQDDHCILSAFLSVFFVSSSVYLLRELYLLYRRK